MENHNELSLHGMHYKVVSWLGVCLVSFLGGKEIFIIIYWNHSVKSSKSNTAMQHLTSIDRSINQSNISD